MISFFKKKVIILIIILLLLFFVSLLARKDIDVIPQIVPDSQKVLNFKTRDEVIDQIKENLNILPTKKINGSTYFLAWYQERKFQDNNNTYRPAGFMVFNLGNNQPVLFWESKEEMNNNGQPRFQDINNDNVDEIVWEGDLSVTGSNNSFYIYKFLNNNLILITPTKTLEGITPNGLNSKSIFTLLSGDSDLTYMKDIDNDDIPEITVGSRDGSGKVNSSIYKFNGTKYYLWKEEVEDDKRAP